MTGSPQHEPGSEVFVDRVRRARLTPFESQHVFRTLLDSLARPGRIAAFEPALTDRVPPALLGLLALADVDVTISVTGPADDTFEGSERCAWEDVAAAACGAPVRPIPHAAIVTALASPEPSDIERLEPGTALAPERGAKVFIACRAIHESHGPVTKGPDSVTMRLTGPGVPGERMVTLVGVRAGTIDAISRVNGHRPAGIDTWFVADDGTVVGLPRSTRIVIVEPSSSTTGTI